MSLYDRETRARVADTELIKVLQESCSKMGMDITEETLYKLFVLIISTTADYLYHTPEIYFKFPNFDVLRSSHKDNLIKIDIHRNKDIKNAEDLHQFQLSEELERRKLLQMMEEFIEDLTEHSLEKEDESSDIIKQINIKKSRKKKGNSKNGS